MQDSNNKKTRVRYFMLGLVFVNVVINYLDRSNLSVAAAGMGDELQLSSVQLGLIFSAFGWTYAALQIPGGLVADRIGPRILYSVCLWTWSFATIAQGFAKGFVSLFAFRLATGAFEAPSYPINNRIVTSWFPEHERASAIALYVSGQFIGLAFQPRPGSAANRCRLARDVRRYRTRRSGMGCCVVHILSRPA